MTSVRIPEQKVILCGEYGVGKSSLFRRFTSNTFTTANDRQSTLGLDHYSKIYHSGGKDIKVLIYILIAIQQFKMLPLCNHSYNFGILVAWREWPQ